MGVGYTFNLDGAPSFSVGIVNATDRSFLLGADQETAKTVIQTSLSIRPGETGGPVINASSEVVGLMLTPYTYSQAVGTPQRNFSVQLAMGSTLVIPINRVREDAEWLLAKHESERAVSMSADEAADRPWLGLTGGNITDVRLRKQINMPQGGVLVSYIFPGDPAESAGILENDVLKQWNGTPIRGVDHLKQLIGGVRVGEKVELTVIRGGKEQSILLPIGRY